MLSLALGGSPNATVAEGNAQAAALAEAHRTLIITLGSASMAVVAIVVALLGASRIATKPALRARLVSSGITLASLALISPLIVNMPRWLSPVVFFSDGCAHVDFFVIMQAVMASLGTALVGSAWPRSDDEPYYTKPLCCCCSTGCVCSRGGAKGMVSVVAHFAIVLGVATGVFRHADSAWATVLTIAAVGSISFRWIGSSFKLPGGAAATWKAQLCSRSDPEPPRGSRHRRRVSMASSTAAIDCALVAVRGAMAAALLGFMGSLSSHHEGCDTWQDQLAVSDPDHRWPAGLDLSVPGPERDRATDVARMTLLFTTFATQHGVFLAASLLLEFQATLAAGQAKAMRNQADTMMRAVTYVSHHARGPLNAAVLCMALLQMDDRSVGLGSDANLPMPATGPSGLHTVPQLLVTGMSSGKLATESVPLSTSTARPANERRLAAEDSRRGNPLPTVQATLRDLQIALESAKQELDDLLLWQRLSFRKTSSIRSWGTMGTSWEQRLGSHFSRHRRAAALTLDTRGCRIEAPLAQWQWPRTQDGHLNSPPASRGWSRDPGSSLGRSGAFESHPSGRAAKVAPAPPWMVAGDSGWPGGQPNSFRGEPGPAFLWAVFTDHARVMQAAVAMVAIGTYAAATRSSRAKPGRVCVSVSVSTGRRAMAGLQWSQQLAPRRGMRGSERGVLCVEVRFTGQGYSATELEGDPFDPFGRLRHGDDSLLLGPTGLRLAVVRGVAVSLGGEAGLGSGGSESGAHVWLRVPVMVIRRSSEAWADHLRRQRRKREVVPRSSASAVGTSVPKVSGSVPRVGGTVPSLLLSEDLRVSAPEITTDSAAADVLTHREHRAAPLRARGESVVARSSESMGVVGRAPLSGWRVWVADDDDTTARVSALVLRRSGATTRTFSHGAQLVAAAQALMQDAEAGSGPSGVLPLPGSLWDLPDGVLVDGHMPVMGGVDAIRAIVALGNDRVPWWRPRLWLVTGEVTPEVESEAMRAGADGVLCKPVTGAVVVASLLSDTA